jgi:hypothetical protein
MRRLFRQASAFILFLTPAFADDLTPLPAPDARPYPYKILDIQPGQIAADIVPQIEEHLGGSLAPVIMQQAVTSPEGRQFEADITTGFETLGVSLHTRMGEQPYEEVLLTTATPVLEGRVIKIWRNMRQPNADLPDPAELTAQLEALYGLPSWVGPDSIGARMVKYVWTPSGQLAPQQEEPCSGANYLGYSFDNDRKPVAPPECSAVFTMSHETKAGQSTVRFSLIDFDLARQDLEETDRQILEQISDEGVQPSDMKL